MAEWSSWLPDVRRLLPLCPDLLIGHAVKRAAQEFCARTGAWKRLLPAVAVPAGSDSIVLVPADDAEIVSALHVWLDGNPLGKKTAEELFNDDPKWPAATGAPTDWLEEEPGTLRLYPIPVDSAATGLVARVSQKPGEEATGIGDAIAAKYREHIAERAVSILMMDPDKAWTNLELGALKQSRFESDTDAIRTKLALESVRVKSRPVWC